MFAVGGLPTVLFLAFIGLPIVAIIVRGAGYDGFWSGFGGSTLRQALKLSLITSAISLAIIIAVGTPMAYFLARRRFPGHSLVDACIELPLVLPPVVAGLGMLMAFGRTSYIGRGLEHVGVSLPFTTIAVVFAQIFIGAPFFVRAAKIGFESVDPGLEDLARTLGEPPSRVFLRITIPLASKALIGGIVLAWARAISEFGATLIFAGNLPGRTQTMPVAVMSALERSLGSALALAVALLLIAVILLVSLRLLANRGWSYQP